MTHLKKKHNQFALGAKDASVVGRLGGGYPLYGALDWYWNLYGVGLTGVGNYGGSNAGSTSNQETGNDGTNSGEGTATGDAAGSSGDGSGAM
jgi:hypothetical protein